uniref:Uncharacterized protein n=1 Tax=Microviridae sp. ctE3S2 TaxID=2824989 RepID=A0A8S5V8J2_9VIRU|nr:MAG TPA: hypothetical protein [Microviridae sp. ctE3S2]
MIKCSLVELGKTSYFCNFVKIKGKSIFPLRGAQINSNFVACVRNWKVCCARRKARPRSSNVQIK